MVSIQSYFVHKLTLDIVIQFLQVFNNSLCPIGSELIDSEKEVCTNIGTSDVEMVYYAKGTNAGEDQVFEDFSADVCSANDTDLCCFQCFLAMCMP